jgi:hypothetical protein
MTPDMVFSRYTVRPSTTSLVRPSWRVGVFAILTFHPGVRVGAQIPLRWAVDLSVGTSHGKGGYYYDRVEPALDASFALSLRTVSGHSPTVAFSVGYLGSGGYDAVCNLDVDGGCIPEFPHVSVRSVLLGWEWLHPRGASFRVLLGPAYIRGGGADPNANGVQARAEVTPLFQRSLAPVVGTRLVHVTDYQGSALRWWSWGVGLRFR